MSTLLEQASLVMIPSGYKEDVVYSQIPTSGAGDLSFTRASNGTRINSAGLVEVCPWNILEYSEDFANAYWYAETGNTLTSNTTTAPNGTTTADTITATSGNEINLHNFASFTITANTYTLSQYLKSNGTNLIESYIYNISTGFVARGEINFANGTFTASIGSGSIENVGNGWYRISLTASLASGSITTGFFTTSTTGTRSAFVWGAQLNIGSTAKPYFPTTDRLNVPRLTYQNGGGGCPSLLLEKQSTNLFPYSEDFTNGVWSLGGLSITANNTTSPDGTQNADKFTEDSSNGNHLFYNTNAVTLAATTSVSIFYKKGTRRYFSIKLQIGTSSYTQVFDADAVTTGSNSSNGLTSVSTSIVSMGNGWVRATLTGTDPNASTACYIICSLSNSATPSFDPNNFNPTYQGTGTDNGFFWGAQIEASSYPTSYIPTTSASATRVVDQSQTALGSSIIGQSEGVLFLDVDFSPYGTGVYNNPQTILIRNGSSYANYLYIASQGMTGQIVASIVASGLFIYLTSSQTLPNRFKCALAYKSGDTVFYVNGNLEGTSTTTFSPLTLNDLRLNHDEGSLKINEVAIFKTRLTNAELASLTTI
jgi:hypothetical protein